MKDARHDARWNDDGSGHVFRRIHGFLCAIDRSQPLQIQIDRDGTCVTITRTMSMARAKSLALSVAEALDRALPTPRGKGA